MALFFYRAWAGEASENRGGVRWNIETWKSLVFLQSERRTFSVIVYDGNGLKEFILVLKTQISKRLSFPTRLELTPDNPLYYTRYGYAALLGITLFGGLLLNGKLQHRSLPQHESSSEQSQHWVIMQVSTFWATSSAPELSSKFLMQP